jgi:hypothetical protein
VPSDQASGSTLTPVWNRFPARLIHVATSRAPRQLSHSILSFAHSDEVGSAQLTCRHNSPIAAAVLLLKLSARSAGLATAQICALLVLPLEFMIQVSASLLRFICASRSPVSVAA